MMTDESLGEVTEDDLLWIDKNLTTDRRLVKTHQPYLDCQNEMRLGYIIKKLIKSNADYLSLKSSKITES